MRRSMQKFNDFETVQQSAETAEHEEQVEEQEEDIVISGISGIFPSSKTLEEFEDNLRNGRNLIQGTANSSLGVGKIPNVEKFDASYFGLTPDYADAMDPMGRLLLEKVYESVIDSGYNPESLKDSKTGVFIGIYMSETEAAYFSGGSSDGLVITAVARSFLANRISYCFGFQGPSLCVDTSCSSSMHALHLAHRAIRNNECESAIVGGCNLCLNNGITLQFQKLGVVNPDGVPRIFDEAGNGYCRAETVCTIFLQKRRRARRVYATIIHTKVNCDGYKAEGIAYPSFVMQKQLLKEFYQECNVDPSSVNWVELHATGTRAGDREEVKAVEILCENRVSPLKIASVRSNMGHAEAASTLCSIAKVIISMRSGLIPANINYSTPRNDIDALHNGLVEVITENTVWNGGLVAINSFGLGGANGHALLKSFDKKKMNAGLPQDHLPRAVTASGRTPEAVDFILSELARNPIDEEYVSLLHEIHGEDNVRHLYRGAIILRKNSNESAFRETTHCPQRNRTLWFVFGGIGCQWAGMGKGLMRIPIFAQSILQCDRVLKKKGVDLIRIICDDDPNLLENVVDCFVGITAIQIALVDVLKALSITPDGMIGHSAGEVACAYADNCLTKEQTILCAYYRGLSCVQTDMASGAMAAVGLSRQELEKKLPPDVDIACHNAPANCTISGPAHLVNQTVDSLQNENVFVRRVQSLNIAFHSRYVEDVAPKLFDYLQKVIPVARLRSQKWISTSAVSKNERIEEKEDATHCSARYFVNNMKNRVLFEEATRAIPNNAIVVEISAHCVLRTLINRVACSEQLTYISLATRQCPDSVEYLLQSVCKLFLNGRTPKLASLYPLVNYPVSKETRMIAPLVKWQHDRDWNVAFSKKEEMVPGERRYVFNPRDKEHAYVFDHIIDGRSVVPGFAYLLPIWEVVPLMHNKVLNDTSIVFEKLRFQRMINLSRDRNIKFLVQIQKGSGNFEILESNQIVLSGRVYVPEDVRKEMTSTSTSKTNYENKNDKDEDAESDMNQEDIYKEFQLRGYEYKNNFRQMISSNNAGTRARVKWNDNWITFLDTMAQIHILQTDTRYPCLLTSVDKLVVDINAHRTALRNNEFQNKGIPVYAHKKLDIVEAGGIQIRGIKGRIMPRRKLQKEPQLASYKFTPYTNLSDDMEEKRLLIFYASLIRQNTFTTSVNILEYRLVNSDVDRYDSIDICIALNYFPHLQSNAIIVTSDTPSESALEYSFVRFANEAEKLGTDFNAHLIIMKYDENEEYDSLDKLKYLSDDGFLMIRMEKVQPISQRLLSNFSLCCQHISENEKILLLRRKATSTINKSTPICLRITPTLDWLERLKEELKSRDNEVILYAEADPYSGIIGLNNCLRRELATKNLKCFFILDEDVPPFSSQHPFYLQQISLNLCVNVYKNKTWGCFAHFPLPEIALIKTPFAFVKINRTGDLRTLAWFQKGNAFDSTSNDMMKANAMETKLIHVYYSALNFKDILLATGFLSYEMFLPKRTMQECLIGCEFCGRDDQTGKRYMGMHPAGAISTVLLASKLFMWPVPDTWSMEEAATVPVVYLTVVSAFFVHGNLRKGQSILIHSGAGGVGQAAINIATHYNCEIFTTVGSAEKREFIKNTFPHIDDSHIGNSRDAASFEQLVMSETKGRGVDLVLNSLAGDKLLASVRCLAKGGRFLEIGKLDLLNDNALGMNVFLRGISFHCILLDTIHEEDEEKRNLILTTFERELNSGSIKPIVRKVFADSEVESAFRFMAAGKHIGKVLIKIRDEENDLFSRPTLVQKLVTPRFNCSSKKVYIICGGLGGMGLELADWLALRGAKTIILTSRVGVVNGYQRMRIKLWKSYGTTTLVRTDDLTQYSQVNRLLSDAENMGQVDAIFNLVAVTEDKLIEDQDISSFEKVAACKKQSTLLLDQVSRKLCPHLKHFVVFSSLSSGYGNSAQANYGFANSCCESICEKRKQEGWPALAIQWGAVGDVGILMKMDWQKTCNMVGLKLQPIRSCLETLDRFLTSQSETVVSSYILGDKNIEHHERTNLVESIANILGIRDTKTISFYSPLPELGMDSVSGLEVKQTLEQQCDIFLSPKEIISLTFADLEEIQKTGKKSSATMIDDNSVMVSVPYLRNIMLNKAKNTDLFRAELVVKLPQTLRTQQQPTSRNTPVFCFPSIDGIASSMESLTKNLSVEIHCFQYIAIRETTALVEQADILARHIIQTIPTGESYNILAYSYGVVIAMETMKILHSNGRKGKAVFIDGSFEFAKTLSSVYFGNAKQLEDIQSKVVLDIMSSLHENLSRQDIEREINRLDSWDSKLNYMISKFPSDSAEIETFKFITNYLYQSYKPMIDYNFEIEEKINAQIAVIKAKKMVIPMPADVNLNQYFASVPQEFHIDENHFTILRSKRVAEIIENFFE